MRQIIRNKKLLFTIAALTGFSTFGWAQDAAPTTSNASISNDTFLLIIIGLLLFILLVMAVIMNNMSKVMREVKKGGNYVKQPSGITSFWNMLDKKFFTRAVPVEREADVMLDHDYDGIKELDNALPPWWKWGFYITLILAVFYILRFHVWKTGPDPIQEYNAELAYAAKQAEAFRAKAGEQVDEKTVTLADAAGIATGKTKFLQTCSVCHGQNGEGGVGPNLTDNYWLHGGTINDIFKTIKYGVPEKGMQSWEKAFSPADIKNLSSYVKSLVGTTVANGKAPQGNLFTEGAPAADTTNMAPKDTAAVK
ncbi:MAG: cbb3-type cytochrome c oxidase N-terminal domain-containing protein [Chitinophagaceae bacterium]|nr:cbb3-type cytochrome c oxidase N-terminal domain-containing protein [Chitinophagaceae bacterium]